jgi:hypothetical protein
VTPSRGNGSDLKGRGASRQKPKRTVRSFWRKISLSNPATKSTFSGYKEYRSLFLPFKEELFYKIWRNVRGHWRISSGGINVLFGKSVGRMGISPGFKKRNSGKEWGDSDKSYLRLIQMRKSN